MKDITLAHSSGGSLQTESAPEDNIGILDALEVISQRHLDLRPVPMGCHAFRAP